MSSTGGIIRTASGRETYLPDGLAEEAPIRINSETLSSATSKTLNDGDSPMAATTEPRYLTSDGKEAAEDPIDVAESRDGSSTDVFEPINAGDAGILTRLASQVSRSQSYYGSRRASTADGNDLERTDTLAGLEHGQGELDPNSSKFDLYKWIRFAMRAVDQDDIKIARAGVTMKNVTVRGTGSALNLQKNVGSILMSPLRFAENFSFGKKASKTIIRDFDVLMKNGEMLIVLGRPGSGCSTLLKTMTGEMHGLQVDEQSTIHYNGIPQQQMMKEFKGEVVYNQEVDKHFP